MNIGTRRILLSLTPVLLLGACGSPPSQRTARLLNERLQDRMAPDIAAGHASLQSTGDGARVTLLGDTLFPNGKLALDDQYSDVRANLLEALLDPALMHIEVTDTSALPDQQRTTRINNVEQYLFAYGLGNVIRQPSPSQTVASPVPTGLTLTISVVCPRRADGTGYDGGQSKPACE